MTRLRNLLILKFYPFLVVYSWYLRLWNFISARGEDREDLRSALHFLIMRKFKGSDCKIECKVLNRLRHNYLRIPLLPNWLLMRKWRLFGKEFQFTHFKWCIFINYLPCWSFWQDMDFHFGKLCEIAIRWQNGKRKYVAFRLWLKKNRPWPSGSIENDRFGSFDFVHEIELLGYKYPVSRWWWGDGYINLKASRWHIAPLYHHYGGLLRFRWRGRMHEFFGKTLTATQKEKLYWDFYQTNCYSKRYSRQVLDAITGRTRNVYKELFSACCIECRRDFDPYWPGDGFKSWLLCSDCHEARQEKSLAV